MRSILSFLIGGVLGGCDSSVQSVPQEEGFAGLEESPWRVFEREADYQGFAHAIASADFDLDGRPDLAISEPGFGLETPHEGRVRVFFDVAQSGPATWSARGGSRQAFFGSSLEVGDFDGDGAPDLLIGSCARDLVSDRAESPGSIAVYLGGPGGLENQPSLRVYGRAVAEQFGCRVAAAGDVDGDGDDEILVGSDTRVGGLLVGRAAIFDLNEPDATWTHTADPLYASRLSGASDLNGDGYDDVAIGNPYAGPGRVEVFLGGGDGLGREPDFVLAGNADREQFGSALAGPGDLDGDSYGDLVVGAKGALTEGAHTGRVTAYFGGPGAPMPGWGVGSDRREPPWGPFGCVIAPLGDLNRDGRADLAVGAPLHFAGATNMGLAAVYLGDTERDLYRVWRRAGASGQTYFGSEVVAVADADQDGFSELAVASYELGRDGPNGNAGRVEIFTSRSGP